MKTYILAIDQSTSATKLMFFDKKAQLVHRVSIAHRQYYPQAGFVEHNGIEIFNNVLKGIQQLLTESNISEDQIAGISITNQRETALVWDKTTGIPIANAAVWQCQRGAAICKQLKKKYHKLIQNKTGLIVDPYYSASKLKWILENKATSNTNPKNLIVGTIDSWLVWKLTNGQKHVTDFTNACRTMLFNIHNLEWDIDLLKLFNLNIEMMPTVISNDEIAGYTSTEILLNKEIPIAGLMGDSHAALFGQNCFQPGMTKATYGTGSSIMMNIGEQAKKAPKGLVSSIGFALNKKITYVFEGNIHATGDTINWLKNELQIINHAYETEELANTVESSEGVYLVPAFVGLGAPYWDNKARASITGINRSTQKAHIVRAALEAIGFQIKDLIDLMTNHGAIELNELRVDGGPTRNNFLMQFQSDILEKTVKRSSVEEISALGSAFSAGLAIHFWNSLIEIESLYRSDKNFTPEINHASVQQLYDGWKNAIAKTQFQT